ncbi:MAG: GMC oxidoreductase [Planctomycetia bacterium]|nr:GMC oxidoreductase [Planctomycetia bacterium]
MLIGSTSELGSLAGKRWPVVIIGGGTVGLYAAHELAKRGIASLMVECGGQALADFPQEGYASVGKDHQGIRLGRARNIGGTSNLWGGQLVEFQPADFSGRSWIKDSKWPVGYDEISPYFERTYQNLGIDKRFQTDTDVFDAVNMRDCRFSEGLELFLTRWLKQPSFSTFYAKEIESSELITVLLNHTVVGFGGAGSRINSVKAIGPTGAKLSITGDRFILAAGTIEICRLLLHAADDAGWDCPWRGNQNVGLFFQDHPTGRVATVDVLDRRRFFDTFSTIVWAGQKFQPKLRLTNEALLQPPTINIHAMMVFESSIGENLVYLKQFLKAAVYKRKLSGAGDLLRNLRACRRQLLPLAWMYLVQNRILVPGNSKISLAIQCEQIPLAESRITLDPKQKGENGLPKVLLDWRLAGDELGPIRDFVMRCDRALRDIGLARLNILADLASGNPQFLDTLRDNYHQVGGARMGESANDGVVDKDLRVFGTENLYVVGAATFRTSSNANTAFTALAFVSRLVERLRR